MKNIGLLLLKTIDPAIGNCTKLEELLLNSNELTTLPVEITRLGQLKFLSLGDITKDYDISTGREP